MKKDSSHIKSIFQNIVNQKNEEATQEIKRSKFTVIPIDPKQIKICYRYTIL